MIDLIQLYFPAFSDLAEVDVLNMRARLSTILHAAYPDVDYRPNSPLGDMGLTPISYLLCAAEQALGRFMSDLDLSNIAKGVIWNCDFVRVFLRNFAVSNQATLMSSGTVRLTFNANQPYVLDRRTQYQFSTDTFSLRMAYIGPFYIQPVGCPLIPGTNTRNLVEITPGVYVVDVPVVGTMTTQISAGDSATTDYPIAELTNINALVDFDFGLPPAALPALAAKTRQTFYSATPTTRGGATRLLIKEFPELVGNSAIITGDLEMMRDTINPLGFTEGKLDVLARSDGTMEETQQISIPYDAVNSRFVCPLSLTGIAFLIDSFTAVDAPAVTLRPAIDYIIFSQSSNPARAPMASCAYSPLEKLWLAVNMPLDPGTGQSLIPLRNDTEGNQYGMFQMVYRHDPLLPAVSDLVASDAETPVGVDVLAKGFIPIIIDNMTIKYSRAPGTTVAVTGASAEILAFVNNLAFPNYYSDARIGDSMLYAGAQDVLEIDISAHVQWSVAHRFLPETAPTPVVNYAEALAASLAARVITMRSTKALRTTYRDLNMGTDQATFEALGSRNTILILDPENLYFSQTR